MPFALAIIGLAIILTAVRNTHAAFGQALVGDFTGSGNFIYWILALGVVGAIGYVPELQKFSRAFLILILVGLLLSNRGFFAQFFNAAKIGPQTIQAAPVPAVPSGTPTIDIALTTGGGGSGGLSDLTSFLGF